MTTAARPLWLNPNSLALSPRFCASSASLESRVVESVKRYVELRKDELTRQMDDTTENKDKMLKALETEVSGTTKWDDLGFDDLDKVEVLLEVEDDFAHVIPDEDADKIESVSETVAYLEKNYKQ
eukprot:CAMPEP_0197655070 /NCGR_PEP_ID=MMETSP1338-20131121/39229_1 /TAXON_ID=43686 ORGANISM="Pelagodinium beii, Strain RCC1491" /NCGR_SAMPLE_ID=MMETSP1338 /ASSEMBLY_ACC=CAM_ASM_000754 /LENGTH=124 /DNA_ID=CAMNT_0043230641 /DNA_START=119 /DNA_END=493 /DNA_ORIENTATION=+